MEQSKSKKSIAIIGGGSAALFFAASIDTSRYSVTIYEKNKTLGRKFLVAGDGGFNLTHSEEIEQIILRYTPPSFLKNALLNFDNVSFRKWLEEIGIPTFIGSSKRVYPEKGIKPIEVLNAILAVLKKKNICFNFNAEWKGWKENDLVFSNNEIVKSDIVVFSLGGASWKKTGSSGNWLSFFEEKKVKNLPFQASNCAYEIEWDNSFILQYSGQPLKNIAVKCDDLLQKGEVVITDFGLEGNAIYALSPAIRKQLTEKKTATISIDFKPALSLNTIEERLEGSGNRTKILSEKLKLSKTAIQLIKSKLSKEEFTNDSVLAHKIKSFDLEILSSAPIDKAISTVGGVLIEELNQDFELQNIPNHFCLGEMVNWDAPTGGYLLQGCYSMARELSRYLNSKK